MKEMYIFCESTYEDRSGDIVFESFEGAKAHLLSLNLEGLWYISRTRDNDAKTAVEEWTGDDSIELLDEDYSEIFSVFKIEVRP